MILLFLGPPGSGKGTQAKKISSERGWPQLSTGDMFRLAIARGTDLGVKARSFMDRGALVPDDVVIDVIADRINQNDCGDGFVLDGFPRTIPQAEALDGMLLNSGRALAAVVAFEIADQELLSRLTGRRTCSDCGAMYHVLNMVPKVVGICDQCGGKNLLQRPDDEEQVIKSRLKVYHDQTSPLVEFYERRGVLKRIDASLGAQVVADGLGVILAEVKTRK